MVGRLAAHVLRHTLPFFHRVPVLVRRHRKGFSYLFLHQPFFNTFSVLFPGHGFLVAAVLQRFHADTPRLRQTVQLHAVQASFEISSCVAYPVSRWSQRNRGAEFRQDMTLTSSRDDATPSSHHLSKESTSSAAQLFNRIVVFPAVLKNQVPTNRFPSSDCTVTLVVSGVAVLVLAPSSIPTTWHKCRVIRALQQTWISKDLQEVLLNFVSILPLGSSTRIDPAVDTGVEVQVGPARSSKLGF